MAQVTDYASLNAAISVFTGRADLSSLYDYFIQWAENRIYRDIFTLNEGKGIQDIEAAWSDTINSSGQLSVPTGYLGARSLNVSAAGKSLPLIRKSLEYIHTNHPDPSSTDIPAFFARQGSVFVFGPQPDSQYPVTGIYWQRATGLSGSNTTTWMTANIPDVLLFACISAAQDYAKNSSESERWGQKYEREIADYVEMKKAEEWSGSTLAITAA